MNDNSEQKVLEEMVQDNIEGLEEMAKEANSVETSAETPAVEKKQFPVLGSLQALKDVFANVEKNITLGTPNHNPEKIHGNLTPKKDAVKREKKARKVEKKSRRINRGK